MKIMTKLSLITLCLSAALVAPISAKDVTIYYTNDLHAHVSPGKFQLSIKNAQSAVLLTSRPSLMMPRKK
jgi:2',3'-cyclic-nucleotide 2'-phosphodiesterase (5'-nucleotidase family)